MGHYKQLRIQGIRPVKDLLKVAIGPWVLTDTGVILTYVPFGPLDRYDTLRVETVYYAKPDNRTMVVVSNPDSDEPPHVSPLSFFLEDKDYTWYVRYTEEFWSNAKDRLPDTLTKDF